MTQADPSKPSATILRLANDIRFGDRRALAKGITLVESTALSQRDDADALLTLLMQAPKETLRVGISGVPGAGKSTLIESLGNHLTRLGHRVAVLAIDPTSPISGGSILGDKTRMPQLATNPSAFIRPSPSGETVGGVARHTREAIMLCEAAGYDIILVETVGVGQSEHAVAQMVDVFLMLQLPNSGDELQGIKRGILELADIIAVTKADGDSLAAARRSKGHLDSALHFFTRDGDKSLPVLLVSALGGQEDTSVKNLWNAVHGIGLERTKSGMFMNRRRTQALCWLREEVAACLHDALAQQLADSNGMNTWEDAVRQFRLPASAAARKAVKSLRHS